jgi:hypothetical protein
MMNSATSTARSGLPRSPPPINSGSTIAPFSVRIVEKAGRMLLHRRAPENTVRAAFGRSAAARICCGFIEDEVVHLFVRDYDGPVAPDADKVAWRSDTRTPASSDST